MATPEQIIQRQLDAYNAKDVRAWLASYHPDAEHFELHGSLLARGHSDLQKRIQVRFSEPDLHACLLGRSVMGNIVVDHERIRRNFPEGRGHIEMICIYEVADEVIVKATFALGKPMLERCT
jgi:putative hydrolase of HD superfamily